MARLKSRTSRVADFGLGIPVLRLTDFYREEFLKHRDCLEQQRESFSERAISDMECALAKILGQLDDLCGCENADRVVSALLKRFDVVTRLSAWNDPKTLH